VGLVPKTGVSAILSAAFVETFVEWTQKTGDIEKGGPQKVGSEQALFKAWDHPQAGALAPSGGLLQPCRASR